MKTTGIPSLDDSPRIAAEWLNELDLTLGWSDSARSYRLPRETLHAVRDALNAEEAVDFSGQLPVLIRGVYFDGWMPKGGPVCPRSRQDLLARIEGAFSEEPLEDPEAAVAAVCTLLRHKISLGEIEPVVQVMRKSLRDLWI